jgi:DNA-binding LacI/PurR family transcriptional regulator
MTIKDVARKAHVSPATVSLVLNDTSHSLPISASTRERVKQAAQELGYQPNSFAQALRKNRSSAIAILAFDIVDPYCAHVMRGAEEIINANDYFPMLFDLQNDEQRMRHCISLIKKRRVEGLLILASSLRVDEEVIMAQRSSAIPVVVIGREVGTKDIPTIVTDNVGGSYLAVKHLIELGHSRIGFILGPSAYIDSRQRWEGGAQAMRDHGLVVDESLTVEEEVAGWGPEAGYASMQALLARLPRPTAVFAFDDASAFGAIRAISEAGLRVPEDISVVGFDDLSASAFYNPPLTTVHYSMVDMGRKGAERLLGLIANPSDGPTPLKTVEPSQLIVRKSTAAPSRGT